MILSSRFLVAVCALGAVSLRLSAAEGTVMKWNVEGVEHKALVFSPSSGSEKAPVLFFFHGHGGNMHGIAKGQHFQTLWPEALIVYPQGLPIATKRDPEGDKPGWQREPGELNDRDLKFFDAMISTLSKKYPVDRRRIYVGGFSNGAAFTFLLWTQRAKTIAAFGPCAGKFPPDTPPKIARPAFIVAGVKDPLVKIADAKASIVEAKRINECAKEGKPWQVEGAVLYPSEKHLPVVTYIHPGGHEIPQGANEMLVRFFKLHELPEK